MSSPKPSPYFLLVVSVSVVFTAVIVAALDGNPLPVMAPAIAVGGGYVLLRAPLAVSGVIFLFMCLLFEDVRNRPYMGMWEGPFWAPGKILFDGLEKTLKIPGLKVFGIEAILWILTAVLGIRLWLSSRKPAAPASALRKATLALLVTLLIMWVWGIGRGGNVRFSMLQIRPVLFMTVAMLFYGYALGSQRSMRAVMVVFLTVGVIRVGLGLWFMFRILLRSHNVNLDAGGGVYVTSHHDTLLWCTGLIFCLVFLIRFPSKATLILNLTISPILFIGIVINNRRLAFVDIALALIALYFLGGKTTRHRMHRTLVVIPLLLLYIAAAWNSSAPWAKPVAAFKSTADASDSSSEMRDIENFNLIATAKPWILTGSGFGHEYNEVVVATSIEEFLEAYLFLPHNSILGFMGWGGYWGFTIYFILPLVIVFLAVRNLNRAKNKWDVVMPMVAISAVISYLIQCYGDLGMQDWVSGLIYGCFGGMTGARAVALGSWKNPTKKKRTAKKERPPIETYVNGANL